MADRATEILKEYYGGDAQFREGQQEAIEATLSNRRTLVVQKTGWGKSLVYFICTKMLREEGRGITLVVSPLLALMDNQREAADRLGLKCEILNSTVSRDDRPLILSRIKNGDPDIVFTTPETLFSDDVQRSLPDIKIGLFVIDEAHCISDWGHDFRLDYGNLNKIIAALPSRVPVLATTATANDRVVEDLKRQLGGDVFVSRGSLMRESLAIQIVKLPDTADRYTWILKNIASLPGTGIIYCLTRNDCEHLSGFLNQNGVPALPYYSGRDEAENIAAIKAFSENSIKAIVATVKLGMGFDKGDIGFVIHFQQPSNIVSYYQQIGRAGRKLDRAYAILMSGCEDEKIIDYFIDTAFPTREECESAMKEIEEGGGAGKNYLLSRLNMPGGRLDKTLDFLMNENAIYKQNARYYPSLNTYSYDEEHYSVVTEIRRREKEQMRDLIDTGECYLKFVVNCLDDKSAQPCGKCANCLGRPLIGGEALSAAEKESALKFINSLILPIEPRKRWAKTDLTEGGAIEYINLEGLCLSRYGDVGYGRMVSEDKRGGVRFRDELVERSAEALKELIARNGITRIAFVPSLRSGLVKDFAARLATATGLKFTDVIKKSPAEQQKFMQNSAHQCHNAFASFHVEGEVEEGANILLVDDIVDSRWTLTVCGFRLMEKGAASVTPYALATSSRREDE